MKRLQIILLLALTITIFHSCTKEDIVREQGKQVFSKVNDQKTLYDFTDTTKWELTLVYEELKIQNPDYLLDFLNCHGMPDWENAIFKRGEEINITSIPTFKDNCISGVFKVYHPIDGNPIINYYSIDDINAAIERGHKLSAAEYHAIRGAVQGIILGSYKKGLMIDQNYIDWLRIYNDRIDEKVRWWCIEEWECTNGVVSTATGWVDCDGDGYFETPLSGGMPCCVLISVECYVETVPRNFPGSFGSCACDDETNDTGGGGTYGDGSVVFNRKAQTLNTWMNDNDIPEEFFDLLYACVLYLPSPFGTAAESLIDEECANNALGITGQDWTFDETFWNDQNLTFPIQELPSYQAFYDAFPKNEDGSWMYGADNIYELVGGDVLQAREDYPALTNNTCALKVSIALVGAGIEIPNIPGSTLEGEDGSFYFLNTRALNNWMQETFPNFEEYDSNDYANPDIHTLLNNQTGIIISIYSGNSSASGHADIYTGSRCASSYDCSVSGTVFWWTLN